MDNIKIHEELKNHIWKLKPEEFVQLETNILDEGIRDKLIIWNGYIVDGHNRYKIAQKHNLDFEIVEKPFDNIEQVKDWMDANQIGRRNLTNDQWQISIGRRYNNEKKTHGGDRSKGQNLPLEKTDEILANEYQISPKSVKNYAQKATKYEQLKQENPKLAEGIATGELSFKDINKTIKQAELEHKKEQYRKRVENNKNSKINIFETDKKYRIIYADPPWAYNDKQNISQLGGAIKHYDKMTISQIVDLPIKNIVEKNAVLFLWVTSPLLEESFEIINDWGFKYKTSFIWDKVKHNMGHYNSVRHEFLLIATHGSCTPDHKKLYDSVQSIEKTRQHSEKPIEFMNIIDDLYQHGERIELFARSTKKENWDYWGNEI